MDKLALGLVKWIVLPAAIGAFGFYVVGPKIGKSDSEMASASIKPGIEPIVPESSPVDEAQPPVSDQTPPKTDQDKTASKFDPDVPQVDKSGAKGKMDTSIGVEPDHRAGNDSVDVQQTAKVIAKPKPRVVKPRVKKPAPAPADIEGGGDGAVVLTPKPKPTNPDTGPGEDIKNLKPKTPKPEKKDPADLPKTPPEEPGKDGGGGG